MTNIAVFAAAAFLEIAGCFALNVARVGATLRQPEQPGRVGRDAIDQSVGIRFDPH